MQVVIESDELELAPKEVKDWVSTKMGLGSAVCVVEEPPKNKGGRPKKEPETKEVKEPAKEPEVDLFGDEPEEKPKAKVTFDQVKSAGMALCKQDGGQARLKKCLETVGGYATMKECPEDKYPDLLTLIAAA